MLCLPHKGVYSFVIFEMWSCHIAFGWPATRYVAQTDLSLTLSTGIIGTCHYTWLTSQVLVKIP